MADVEEKAEDEARKKGLDEEETKQYVGGTFNRIKQRRGGYASPHRRRVSRKEEREEESRHWKKYHQHDDSEMNHRIRDSYSSLSPRARNQAHTHFRREGLPTDYSKQSRREKEKMLDYLETQKAKPENQRRKPEPVPDEERPRRRKLKGSHASWLKK